jgi:hypothetical protein
MRSVISWVDIASGAQTERRSGAGPVGGFLGGKNPTGHFLEEPGIRSLESEKNETDS